MGFWQRRKLRQDLDAILHGARTLHHMREDVMPARDLQALNEAINAARSARQGSDEKAMTQAGESLGKLVQSLTPPCRWPSWRENFEVIVVALGVAMAFRAYFYQPFKIPTGSMQPTLYGIHSVEQAAPGFFDTMPLKVANWLVTGSWYKQVEIEGSGQVLCLERDETKPGYRTLDVDGARYYVPNDAYQRWCAGDARVLHVRRDEMTGRHLAQDQLVLGHAVLGDVLWAGRITSGDFVLVNRWVWNFRHPHRGEVMVFSTLGIPNLMQGTHFIKRMCGLPTEALSIHPPDLIINGKAVYDPPTIARVARQGRLPWESTKYSGYQVIGPRVQLNVENPHALRTSEDCIHLGADEYFAMGDNTGSSFDSRYWGPVPERNLLGPATVVHWPFASPRWGKIE